nr:flagellar hook-associated protein FlgK [Clostridia bacterium]
FLDRQYRNENSRTTEWSTRADHLAYVEGLFDELSGTGISDALTRFANSLQEVSKNPVNKEYRTNLLQNASNLADVLTHFSAQLTEKQADQDQAIVVSVNQVNVIARSIGDLNTQISKYELSGQKANDLRDKRNMLLDELSGLTGFEASENTDGELQVRIGGELLIDHDQIRTLATVLSIDNPITGADDSLHGIVWEDTGTAAPIQGGSIHALLNLRDGASANEIGMPYLNEQLNRLARGIAESFNQVHEAGWTMPADSNGNVSVTGVPFFTTSNGAAVFTAANISVNPAIAQDVFRIAASSVQITNSTLQGNNGNALELLTLFDSSALPDIGSYNGFLDSLVGEIAVETEESSTRLTSELTLLSSLDQQRQSVSAVSLDEEATNLIKYQHSYAAAARLITAIDEALDVLINRTGVVGR